MEKTKEKGYFSRTNQNILFLNSQIEQSFTLEDNLKRAGLWVMAKL